MVRVRDEGLKDDSLKNKEYLVVVDRVEGGWRVRSASSFTECQRSIPANGLCT